MILSAAEITLNYGYDNSISMSSGVVHTFDNLDFSNSTILASAKDVTLNRDQLLILTDSVKFQDCFNPIFEPSPEQYVYSSLIRNSTGNYLYVTNPINTGGSISTTSNLNSATVFNFYFPASANTVQIFYTIENTDGSSTNLYLINNSNTNTISGNVITGLNTNYYTYYYILSASSLSLITLNPLMSGKWLNGALAFNTLTAPTPNDLAVPATNIFKATRFSNENFNYDLQKLGQSDLVKYDKIGNSLAINNNSGSLEYNYLITSAFKTLSADTQSLSANVAVLKNYYSPQHDQTALLNIPLRSYTKIYTGLNETDGHDKVHLGYNASTTKIDFFKDGSTYFHYPNNTQTISLSTSTLADYGAYADITPFRSDKIFKKVANYKNYTNWGNSTNNPQNGMYLCSWLSAGTTSTGGLNTTAKPVWVDRYYDPRHVNTTGINLSTIATLSALLTDSTNNYPNLIWDVPTSLTLEPGVLYYYHRIGESDNESIVDSLSGLLYHIDEWGPNLINKAVYLPYNSVDTLTAGKITSFTNSNSAIDSTVKTPYYIINDTYGYINNDDHDFADNKGNTLSFFAYNNDWSNLKGDQILGNYFGGGMGIFVNTPILTPFFTVGAYDHALSTGTVRTFNADFTLLNYETYTTFSSAGDTPALSAYAIPEFVLKGNYDESYYVIDNYSPHYLSTFDPDDLLTSKISLNGISLTTTSLFSATQIVNAYLINKDPSTNNTYIVLKNHIANNSVTYNKFVLSATSGITTVSLVSSVTSSDSAILSAYNNFTVDLSGNPRYYNSNIPVSYTPAVSGYEQWRGTEACITSTNTLFSLSGTGTVSASANAWYIAKDNIPILGVNNPECINCDQEDNLWVTYNTNFLAKIDTNGKILWSKQINTGDPVVTPYSIRNINFIAQETGDGSMVYYTLILDGKTQYIYKVNSDGNVIKKLYVPGLLPGGDCTGFDYQRKFIKPITSVPGIKGKLVVKDSTLSNPTPIYYTLNYSVSGLAVGWHHFALTYNEVNDARLYVDGALVNQTTFYTPFSAISYRIYNYKNNPQISIGTSNFKTGILNDWIQTPGVYTYNGKIADIRFYNIALNNSDIRAISKNYEYNQFTNFSWTMNAPTRGYIEEIERFFLHRMPGSKSSFFNVRVKNSAIVDPAVRAIVENNIRNAAISVAPAYTELRSIIWE